MSSHMNAHELGLYRDATARGQGGSPNGFPLRRRCTCCKRPREQTHGCKLRIAKSRHDTTRFICAECVEHGATLQSPHRTPQSA